MTGIALPTPAPGQLHLRLGLVFAQAVSVGNIIGSQIMRTPGLVAFVCLLDLALLPAFIAADPISGLCMIGLIAICVPVGIVLHRRREAASRALAQCG